MAYQVLPMLITLIPSGRVFHRYGSMCTCRFLLPMWHWAESSISTSWAVALNAGGRLEGAIFAVLGRRWRVCCFKKFEVVSEYRNLRRCAKKSEPGMAKRLWLQLQVQHWRTANALRYLIVQRCRLEYHFSSASEFQMVRFR
jgi:hypothetical protein